MSAASSGEVEIADEPAKLFDEALNVFKEDGEILLLIQEDDVQGLKEKYAAGTFEINSVCYSTKESGKTPQRYSALAYAILQHQHRPDVVDFFLELGADLNGKPGNVVPAVCAATRGEPDILARLIEHASRTKSGLAYLDAPSSAGLTAACASAGLDPLPGGLCLNRLLQAGADVTKEDAAGNTPAYHAAAAGNCDMLQILLNCGCSPDSPASVLNSPLGAAILNGHERCVQLLLSANANLDGPTTDGTNAAHALAAGKWPCTHRLAEKILAKLDDACWGCRDVNGATPCYISAAAGNIDVLEFILKTKGMAHLADEPTTSGSLPAHAAAELHSSATLALLDKYSSAHVHLPDGRGDTPYDIALSADRKANIKLLACVERRAAFPMSIAGYLADGEFEAATRLFRSHECQRVYESNKALFSAVTLEMEAHAAQVAESFEGPGGGGVGAAGGFAGGVGGKAGKKKKKERKKSIGDGASGDPSSGDISDDAIIRILNRCLEDAGLSWSSMSPARLRAQCVEYHDKLGPDKAFSKEWIASNVSEKRIKGIKASVLEQQQLSAAPRGGQSHPDDTPGSDTTTTADASLGRVDRVLLWCKKLGCDSLEDFDSLACQEDLGLSEAEVEATLDILAHRGSGAWLSAPAVSSFMVDAAGAGSGSGSVLNSSRAEPSSSSSSLNTAVMDCGAGAKSSKKLAKIEQRVTDMRSRLSVVIAGLEPDAIVAWLDDVNVSSRAVREGLALEYAAANDALEELGISYAARTMPTSLSASSAPPAVVIEPSWESAPAVDGPAAAPFDGLQENRPRVEPAAGTTSAAACEDDQEGAGDQSSQCSICMDAAVNTVLVHADGSGHKCCCVTCANMLKDRSQPCPMCRKPVVVVLKLDAVFES